MCFQLVCLEQLFRITVFYHQTFATLNFKEIPSFFTPLFCIIDIVFQNMDKKLYNKVYYQIRTTYRR